MVCLSDFKKKIHYNCKGTQVCWLRPCKSRFNVLSQYAIYKISTCTIFRYNLSCVHSKGT